MNANQLNAIQAAKEKNGGELPSDLYLHTNQQLADILYGLSGKFTPPRTSKATLVARIERLSGGATKAISKTKSVTNQKSRGVPSELSATQVAEMKRILRGTAADVECQYSHSKLMPIWTRMGMKAQYPHRSSKASVVERMRAFAQKALDQ